LGQLCKGQLAELPAILYSFYTSITSDYIGVEVGGGARATKWQVFSSLQAEHLTEQCWWL